MVMFSTLFSMMLMSALMAEVGSALDRKRKSALEIED